MLPFWFVFANYFSEFRELLSTINCWTFLSSQVTNHCVIIHVEWVRVLNTSKYHQKQLDTLCFVSRSAIIFHFKGTDIGMGYRHGNKCYLLKYLYDSIKPFLVTLFLKCWHFQFLKIRHILRWWLKANHSIKVFPLWIPLGICVSSQPCKGVFPQWLVQNVLFVWPKKKKEKKEEKKLCSTQVSMSHRMEVSCAARWLLIPASFILLSKFGNFNFVKKKS